jgi:hypothetical protein
MILVATTNKNYENSRKPQVAGQTAQETKNEGAATDLNPHRFDHKNWAAC